MRFAVYRAVDLPLLTSGLATARQFVAPSRDLVDETKVLTYPIFGFDSLKLAVALCIGIFVGVLSGTPQRRSSLIQSGIGVQGRNILRTTTKALVLRTLRLVWEEMCNKD